MIVVDPSYAAIPISSKSESKAAYLANTGTSWATSTLEQASPP